MKFTARMLQCKLPHECFNITSSIILCSNLARGCRGWGSSARLCAPAATPGVGVGGSGGWGLDMGFPLLLKLRDFPLVI